MSMITENEALSRVAFYCSAAEHCRSEVDDKLKKWGLEADVIERILARLEAEKYIDTERYCRAFVDDKLRFSKWGKVKIAQALYFKKIPSETASKYLGDIDEEEYLAILSHLLVSKRRTIRAKDDYDLKAKLIRFAMSRGFEMKYIICCVNLPEADE